MTGTTVPVSALAGDQGVANNVTMTIVSNNNMFGMRYVYVTGFNDMTLVTVGQATDDSVSKARVLIEIDDSDSPTAGTDFTLDATCNGGTNWHAASSYVTAVTDGVKRMYETNEIACTAGTSVKARIKGMNGKNVPIYGLAVAWE